VLAGDLAQLVTASRAEPEGLADRQWAGEVLPAGPRVPGGLPEPDAFARSRERFDVLAGWLAGGEAGALGHAALEERLDADD